MSPLREIPRTTRKDEEGDDARHGSSSTKTRAIEWPTIGLSIAIHSAFLILTWHHAHLPW
jgi:hypothetical protein